MLIVDTVACDPCAGCEEIVCGAALECCGSVAAAPTQLAAAPAVESVVAAPSVTPSPVAAAVPELEPVEPVSATEPAQALRPADEAAEPAPAESPIAVEPEPQEPELRPEPETPAPEDMTPAPQPEPPPAPKPRNIFEEVDETAAVETAPLQPPATEEMPATDAPVDLGDTEPAIPPTTDTAEPVSELDEPAAEPAMDETPAVEPGPDFEPALDPEPAAAAEPLRRWVDDTASYAVVGRLVDVRGEAIEIRKADGRSVTVPLARLSGFDRDYVAEAGTRVVAARQRGPHPRETASR